MKNSNFPVIAGVEINTDQSGRFNLNSLHKASGLGPTKRPSIWLATKTAQDLIEELRQNSGLGQNLIEVIKGGAIPGTFAHELLAVSYAGWISPFFQLQVNQTFLDYKKGKIIKTPNFNNPAEAARAWADEYEKNLIAQQKLEEADREVQRLQGVCNTIAAQFLPGMTPAAFCRQLNGVNVQQVQNHLVKKGMLIRDKRERGFKSASYYRDNWFAEKQQEPVEGVITCKVVLTKKGAMNLYKLYLKGDLPMKANWDGKKTHCLFEEAENNK